MNARTLVMASGRRLNEPNRLGIDKKDQLRFFLLSETHRSYRTMARPFISAAVSKQLRSQSAVDARVSSVLRRTAISDKTDEDGVAENAVVGGDGDSDRCANDHGVWRSTATSTISTNWRGLGRRRR